MRDLRRALNYFRPDRRRIASVVVLLLGSAALNALKPWPLAIIIDSVLGNKPFPHGLAAVGGWNKSALIAGLSAALLLLYLLQAGLAALQNYWSIGIGLNGLARVRNDVFAWLQRLSFRYHQGVRAGDLIYRASWDTYSIQTLFQQGLMTAISSLLSLAVMLIVMLRMNVYLTLVSLALAPVLLLAIRSFGAKMRDCTAAAQKSDGKVTSLVEQTLTALPLIQSFVREEASAQRFSRQVSEAQKERLAQHGSEIAYGLVVAVTFALGAASITWLGARQVMAGHLTVGELLVFLAYLAQLFEPLSQLSHVGATAAGALAGARRVFEILDADDDIPERADAQPLAGRGSGRITFENVSFDYDQKTETLHNLTFNIEPGEAVALIGPSGAGKTTLLHLLPRFFDPREGSIKLDGVDLRQFKLKELRAQVALVSQDALLLPGTIVENIAFGRPGASREQIEAAARAAHADVFVQKLPEKYETVVGEGAANLSAGERQRIHLARAFLKDAPILLLDEPTSALDAESEALIAASLRELIKGRTTLLVAHRPATIAAMSRILKLHDGRLQP